MGDLALTADVSVPRGFPAVLGEIGKAVLVDDGDVVDCQQKRRVRLGVLEHVLVERECCQWDIPGSLATEGEGFSVDLGKVGKNGVVSNLGPVFGLVVGGQDLVTSRRFLRIFDSF